MQKLKRLGSKDKQTSIDYSKLSECADFSSFIFLLILKWFPNFIMLLRSKVQECFKKKIFERLII